MKILSELLKPVGGLGRNLVPPFSQMDDSGIATVKAAGSLLRPAGGVGLLWMLWAVFAWFLVPHVIESAYLGKSFSFLNDIISGRDVHPIEYYLASWESFSWRASGLLLVLCLIPIPMVATRPKVQNYFHVRFGRGK